MHYFCKPTQTAKINAADMAHVINISVKPCVAIVL